MSILQTGAKYLANPALGQASAARDVNDTLKIPEMSMPGTEPAPESATRGFEVRKSLLAKQADAAGSTRSENEADILGYAPSKKRSVSRTLLG